MGKRIIALVLIVFILFPLMPYAGKGKGVVKEIDVLVNNFKLLVEGKGFSHKEVFLYEGDIYVPMTDLGKALGLDASFNSSNRDISLNSKGKLNFDDKSKYPIAYQMGYEIQAFSRIKENISSKIENFLKGTISKTKTKGVDLKSIKVGFSNITVSIDKKEILLDTNPLIYNNDVYIALTSLSPYLYITPELKGSSIDIDCNGILRDKLKDNLAPIYYSIDELVKFRGDLLSRYARQLEELNKKKKIVMDVRIPYEEISSLSDMEGYLNKFLGKIKDLDVNISLSSGSQNWYYIDIDFSSSHDYKWRSLSRRDVEGYIWDVYVAISSLYDEDAKMQGSIKKYVRFDTNMKNIVFNFTDSGLNLKDKVDPVFIQEILKKELGSYNGEYFDYATRMSGFDLELVVTLSRGVFMEKWSSSAQLDFLERINTLISKYYSSLSVNGKIVYDDLKPVLFSIENGKLRSPSLINATYEDLNQRYGTLSVKGLKIPLKYYLHQIDKDNFKLMVNMDFLITDSRWSRETKDALVNLMHEVIKHIIDMWNANVFVQVYDKSQTIVYEYTIFQDTAYMVKANPSGGEVVEGSTVTLSSETLGAKIYYTTDGSMPTTNSNLYEKPIAVSKIIKAFAVKSGVKDSPVSTFEYVVLADKDVADGLDDLTFSIGDLDKDFSKKELNYTLSIPYGSKTVGVTPVANVGIITINNNIVPSKEEEDIDISQTNKITIIHSEEPNKSKNKVYTINIKFLDKEPSDVSLGDGYVFNTTIYGVFSGNLIGNYKNHSIRLLYGTDSIYKEVKVDYDGRFDIDGFDISFITVNYIGYMYEIIDANGSVVVGPEKLR